jgi:hypothetical protein
MKWVAEIILRTVPFDAEDAEEARKKAIGAATLGLVVRELYTQPVEIEIYPV